MSDDFPGAIPPPKPTKHDVSDRYKQGGHLALVRDTKQDGKIIKPGSGIETSPSRVWNEREKRMAVAAAGHLEFGVQWLDDSLGGIVPSDFILVGAESGAGKTELARYIAMHNSSIGKRPFYLALEADEIEIERRTKWGILLGLIEKNAVNEAQGRSIVRKLQFLDWMYGRIDNITGPFERTADEQTSRILKGMRTFYKVKDFGLDELNAVFDEAASESDMVVIDHLHYFDLKEDNENRAQGLIVRRIRQLQQKYGKAIVAVAHTRKAVERSDRLVPSKDDFLGSKLVIGESTKAVMIAPAHDQPRYEEPFRWKTYLAPLKCRVDGSRARFVGLCTFDARRNQYEKRYQIGKLVDRGEKFVPLTNKEMPVWTPEDACNDLE